MLGIVGRRIGWSVVVLLVASAVMFVVVRATTDPLAAVRATIAGGGSIDADAQRRLVDAEARRQGLDRPLVAQYGRWLSGFVRGDWGESSTTRRPVAAEIRATLWNTVQLVSWGIVFAVAMAVTVGVSSAARRHSALDHGLAGLSLLALSMPSFWFALMAIELAVYRPRQLFHLDQPLLYSVGLRSVGGGVLDYPRHLVLPVLTLSLPLIAVWSRYLRTSMLDVLSTPYVRSARAKGAGRRCVLYHHALRNALVPFTTVSAFGIGTLFGGVIVTETIFAWPGMGQLLYRSLVSGDTNVLLPWLVVAASFVLALNLVADMLHCALDPRVSV